MLISELIEELRQLPQNAKVLIVANADGDLDPIVIRRFVNGEGNAPFIVIEPARGAPDGF